MFSEASSSLSDLAPAPSDKLKCSPPVLTHLAFELWKPSPDGYDVFTKKYSRYEDDPGHGIGTTVGSIHATAATAKCGYRTTGRI